MAWNFSNKVDDDHPLDKNLLEERFGDIRFLSDIYDKALLGVGQSGQGVHAIYSLGKLMRIILPRDANGENLVDNQSILEIYDFIGYNLENDPTAGTPIILRDVDTIQQPGFFDVDIKKPLEPEE